MTLWAHRDALVLQALTSAPGESVRSGFLELGNGHARESLGLGLDEAAIHDALLILRDADYVRFDGPAYTGGGGAALTHLSVTGRGMQALGEWPLFDAATSPETIALLLETLAPEAPSEEETQNLRRAAAYVRGLAPSVFRQLATGAIAAVLRAHLGLP